MKQWLPAEDLRCFGKVLEQSEVIREACNKSKLGIEVRSMVEAAWTLR